LILIARKAKKRLSKQIKVPHHFLKSLRQRTN
jgi:hypothetical protein